MIGNHLVEIGVDLCQGLVAAERQLGIQTSRVEFGYVPVYNLDFQAKLLKLRQPPTAIFTSADTAAFGAIKAARAAGLRVPDDISIVGFDDIPEASLVMPPLTTVRQPLMEMGATAVHLLQRLMDEPGATPRKTELETELVVRGSTAPPSKARRG